MKYGITKIVNDFSGFIDIDKIEYFQIREARRSLFEALFLEEKIDLVTENYYEYETELLSIASRMAIFRDDNYFSMSQQRNIIGRRIVNLLSACRMYLDQSEHHINNIYEGNSDIALKVEKEKSRQYDEVLGYRVMEALRNYIQHRGSPIHSMKLSYEKLDFDNRIRLLHIVVPLIKVSALEDDGKFKKSVLDEMRSIQNNDELDIRPLIREYIESIGKVHEKTRELIRSDIEKWENTFDSITAKFQKEFGVDVPLGGLAVVAERENGSWEERQFIFKDFIERRKNLESKNGYFNNLHIAYASNEIREDK